MQVVSHQYDVPGIDFRTIAISVLIYLGAPLVAAIVTRYVLIAVAGERWYSRRFLPAFGPVALLALIYTVRTASFALPLYYAACELCEHGRQGWWRALLRP